MCKNENCIFCKTTERFEELYRNNVLPVPNIKEKDIIINPPTSYFSDIVDFDDGFPSKIVNMDIVEEHDSNDIDVEFTENFQDLHEEPIDTTCNIGNLLEEFENNCNHLMTYSNEHNSQQVDLFDMPEKHFNGNMTENHNEEFLSQINPGKSSTYAHIFNTANDSKSEIIDRILTDTVSYGFWPTDHTIFNWLSMPYYFRTHTKIVRILLLHLDVFKFTNTTVFDELKQEYAITEAFANHYNVNALKHLCYDFLQKLYDTLADIPDIDFSGKPLCEKVMRLLHSLFETCDLTNESKVEYTLALSCSSCPVSCTNTTGANVTGNTADDYFVRLTAHDTAIAITNNRLVYDTICQKCKKPSTRTITFHSVPQSVAIYCAGGLAGDLFQYDDKIVANDGRRLSVVSIVEMACKYSFREDKERPIDRIAYDRRTVGSRASGRSGYCVHFRNTSTSF